MRTWPRRVLWSLLLGLSLAQAIPVSRINPETNPARSVLANAAVPADVRALLERSCADCHSNATIFMLASLDPGELDARARPG